MAYAVPRFCFLVIIAVMGIFSIATIVVKNTTMQIGSQDHGWPSTFDVRPESKGRFRDVCSLPLYLEESPTELLMAAAIISMVISFAGLAFVIWVWPNATRTYILNPNRIFPYALVFDALLSLYAMLYIFVAHTQSSHFDPNYADGIGYYGPWDAYENGIFDAETWTCSLAEWARNGAILDRQCRIESAGRWMSLVLWLLAVSAAGVAFWALRLEQDNLRKAVELKKRYHDYWVDDGF